MQQMETYKTLKYASDHADMSLTTVTLEGWINLAGEDRPWIYSNPIYVR